MKYFLQFYTVLGKNISLPFELNNIMLIASFVELYKSSLVALTLDVGFRILIVLLCFVFVSAAFFLFFCFLIFVFVLFLFCLFCFVFLSFSNLQVHFWLLRVGICHLSSDLLVDVIIFYHSFTNWKWTLFHWFQS